MEPPHKRKITKICLTLSWMYLLGVLNSFACIATGSYIQYIKRDKNSIIPTLASLHFPLFLIISGCFGFGTHFHIAWCVRNFRLLKTRRALREAFLVSSIIVVVTLSTELTPGISCIKASENFTETVTEDLLESMNMYRDDKIMKIEIDRLQEQFLCCGSSDYSDWFHTGWIHPDYIATVDLKTARITSKGKIDAVPEEVYYGKLERTLPNRHVPFSCCNLYVLRPCIHEHVLDSEIHFNYNFNTSHTIYTEGCAEKINNYFRKILKWCGILITCFACLSKIPPLVITCYYFKFLEEGLAEPEHTATGDADKTQSWKAIFPWFFKSEQDKNSETKTKHKVHADESYDALAGFGSCRGAYQAMLHRYRELNGSGCGSSSCPNTISTSEDTNLTEKRTGPVSVPDDKGSSEETNKELSNKCSKITLDLRDTVLRSKFSDE